MRSSSRITYVPRSAVGDAMSERKKKRVRRVHIWNNTLNDEHDLDYRSFGTKANERKVDDDDDGDDDDTVRTEWSNKFTYE